MRLSRYTIVSDRNDDGSYVLLHGVTGAMDVVTEAVVGAMGALGTFRAAQGVPMDAAPGRGTGAGLTAGEVAFLADRGYLTEQSDEEEQHLVGEVAAVLHDAAATRPSFLALPTLDCNYRCTYCFERPVQLNLRRRDSRRHPELELLDIKAAHSARNVVMTPAVADAMFAAMDEARRNHGDEREHPKVVLYGGEPLDAANEPVVRYIVGEGARRGYTFSAITNGHHVDRFLDLFGPGLIEQVQISIDGPERIHDARRIALGGQGSFNTVIRNTALLLDRGGVLVQIRVHLDSTNVQYFEELLAQFEDIGWLGHPDVLIYANTTYKMSPGAPVAVDLELDEIDDRLRHLARAHRNLMLNAPAINMRAKWLPELLRGNQVPVQGNYCTANTGQYVFAPDGHVYSCWESVGKADSRIGTFYRDGVAGLELDPEASGRWFGRHVGLIPECRSCPMALLCGGGCAQFALYRSGTQLAPFCDNFDALVRSGLRDTAAALVRRLEEMTTGREPEGLVAANYG